MKIDLDNPKHLILGFAVLVLLYWTWTEQGRLEERCEQRGGRVVAVGGREDREDYCRFPNGGQVPLSDLSN